MTNPNYNPSLFSLVTVKDNSGVEPDKEYLINYSDYNLKVWFTKTLVWALSNKRTLLVTRATPRDLESRQLFIPKPETVS